MGARHFAVLTAAVLLVSSCGKGGGAGDNTAPAAPSVDTKVSPLTGLKQATPPANPVYLVKIENTDGGEPQYGLNQADFVVEELVEGGITRLAAVYYSKLPTKVGHVRSSRTTDIGLAEPLGATIVASGGAPKTLKEIKASGLKLYTYDAGAPGFTKDPNKTPPYHVLWNLQTLNKTAQAGTIQAHYFDFGTGPAATDVDKKVTSASVTFSPATTTKWTLSGGKWSHSPEHAAGGEGYKADTMIVVFVRVTDAGYKDPAGNPVPESVVQGSGRAVIFTGGNATEAVWHKPTLKSSFKFTSKKTGKPVTIKPGHIWLEAVPRGGEVSY